MRDTGRATGELVRQNVVPDIHAGLAGGDNAEPGTQSRCGSCARQGAKKIDGVVINLMIGTGGDSDAIGAEGGRESSAACQIDVKVEDEIISDIDGRYRSEIDSESAKSSGAMAVKRLNFVAVDGAVCWDGGHFDGIGA